MTVASAARTAGATTETGLRAVDGRLHAVLTTEAERWAQVEPSLACLPLDIAAFVLGGGKRLRPAFLLAGVVAAGGDPDTPPAVDLAAALELLHAFALIHDDVMDGSETRRGRPALHVDLEREHRRLAGTGDPRRYGEGIAVLAGDLAFVYADRLVPDRPKVQAVWHELRIELTMGQYLDVRGAGLGGGSPARSRLISTLKSGRYTVGRPLHLAAALTGRDDLVEPFSRYGDPLGRAFQLRDDVLGVFGSPASTGKPAGDDIRESKPTVLLELARQSASGAQLAVLATAGRRDLDDQGVERVRAVIVETGALAAVEAEIEREADLAALAIATAPVTPAGRATLVDLGRAVVERDR